MNIANVKIKAQNESSYPIIISSGILNNAYEYIERYTCAKKILIVTNPFVYELYGRFLERRGASFCILPDGEQYKTMEYLNKILDKALELKLERTDAMTALGGGVIGDMTGFAASVYKRGIDYIQIPTTLLAQIDSSVGGKTAVNHKLGKNMLGSFYQPKLVLADINTLSTLDERQFKTGMSEALKYAFIEKSCGAAEDYNLLNFFNENKLELQKRNKIQLKNLITACCSIKSAVVNQDEKEKGLRALLNFGHTYAHAIENITGYTKYTHGEAVSIGMRAAFDLSLKLGRITGEYRNSAVNLIKSYGLITELDFAPDKETFYNAMLEDKKTNGSAPVLILPCAPGNAEIVKNIDKKIILECI